MNPPDPRLRASSPCPSRRQSLACGLAAAAVLAAPLPVRAAALFDLPRASGAASERCGVAFAIRRVAPHLETRAIALRRQGGMDCLAGAQWAEQLPAFVLLRLGDDAPHGRPDILVEIELTRFELLDAAPFDLPHAAEVGWIGHAFTAADGRALGELMVQRQQMAADRTRNALETAFASAFSATAACTIGWAVALKSARAREIA